MQTDPEQTVSEKPAHLRSTFDDDALFDLLRGLHALTGEPIVGDLARLVAEAPRADVSIAFNHKQIASKLWLRDTLATKAPSLGRILIVGGWRGVLSALLLNDARLQVDRIVSLDIDPDCAASARILNQRFASQGRFEAVTQDMHAFDYGDAVQPRFDCVINTSCEHIPDLQAWLAPIPVGTRIALQSNDYRREPDHVACVDSLPAFESQAALASIDFSGELPTKNYRRFMLIGRR